MAKSKFKQKFKFYMGYVWQMIKDCLPGLLMYLCAGMLYLMMVINLKEEGFEFTFKKYSLIWIIGAPLVAAAYNGVIAWANGGSHYEMLASGNVKRTTAQKYGEGYKISSHKEAKEYRVWKGFAVGGIMAILPVIMGIVMAVNQSSVDALLAEGKINGVVLLATAVSGWTVMPIYYANGNGANLSYLLSILFAIIPIVVTGVFYICGAYARRNKAIRQQQIADAAAKAQEEKTKKINYGGLPGTKPKKRK